MNIKIEQMICLLWVKKAWVAHVEVKKSYCIIYLFSNSFIYLFIFEYRF